MTQLIWYSLIGGLFSLIGGLFFLWRSDLAARLKTPLLAFAAGAFMAASFLDILPEAVESVTEPQAIFTAALVGFSAFFFLERVLMRYLNRHIHESEKHQHDDHTESLPILLVLGDSFHNFLDGLVIAISYLANPILGLTTTLAVAAHEIPQEIGDFTILLNEGWSKLKIIAVNVAQSLLTVVGVLLGYYVGHAFAPYLPYLLGAAGGIFLYIAASDIIPEVHHHAGHKTIGAVVLPFLASLILVGYLISLVHGV